jgi:hypothetical protein
MQMAKTIQLNNIPKYISLFYILSYLFYSITLYNIGGLYLEGNVLLGVHDERHDVFFIDVPFTHSHVMFNPEHHFSFIVKWNEVIQESCLIAHFALSHLTMLLSLLLAFYIFWNSRTNEKLFRYAMNISVRRLILLVIGAIVLENLCKLGAEYYKILFFQKYCQLVDASWYLYNIVRPFSWTKSYKN